MSHFRQNRYSKISAISAKTCRAIKYLYRTHSRNSFFEQRTRKRQKGKKFEDMKGMIE